MEVACVVAECACCLTYPSLINEGNETIHTKIKGNYFFLPCFIFDLIIIILITIIIIIISE